MISFFMKKIDENDCEDGFFIDIFFGCVDECFFVNGLGNIN